MDIFEQASRLKLRFGQYTVEDLWDLPLQSMRGISLDDIAVELNNSLKTEAVSFVVDVPKEDAKTRLGFDVVRRVIEVRKAEADVAKEARGRAEQKQKILAMMADKQDETLRGKSLEELREMLAKL